MKHSLITFFLLLSMGSISKAAYSKELFNFPETNPDIEKCIEDIITSRMVIKEYPELLSNQKDDNGYELLLQTDKYCSCQVTRLQGEYELKKNNEIAWSFRDKSIGLGIMDQCALKHYSQSNLNLMYDIMISTKIRRSLEGKLNGRMVAGIRHFASTSSIQNTNLCLQAKIMQKCTKIKSLRSTYTCIQEVTSSGTQMLDFEKNCPTYSTHSLEDEDLSNLGDMI
ncbi:MAG: hypothetical protein EP326_13370 [Deltaproteobacteria bacterium]|nr:MAG: hypothetical protein EP326_13370 [Deltaproteobacteria bacterium]TNF25848.1 MAG: hypothetical protein EP319_15400 [Deltaproteobacteria bacterium]